MCTLPSLDNITLVYMVTYILFMARVDLLIYKLPKILEIWKIIHKLRSWGEDLKYSVGV